jgi:hypothetical protein
MTANHVFLVVLAALFFLSLLVQTMSIKWGLKWAAVAEISLIKALGLYFLFLGAGLLAGVMVGLSVAFAFRNLTALPLNLIGHWTSCAIHRCMPHHLHGVPRKI